MSTPQDELRKRAAEVISSPEKERPRSEDYVKATLLVTFVLGGMLAMGAYSLFNIARGIDNRPISTVDAPKEGLSPITQWWLQVFDAYPWVGILLVLMAADVVTGILAGVIKKKLSSKVSWPGMAKKSIVLILVGVSAVLENQSNGIPLAKLVASAFTVTELISIVENAGRAGIIVPKPLANYISSVLQKPAKPDPVHIEKAERVELHQHIEPPK